MSDVNVEMRDADGNVQATATIRLPADAQFVGSLMIDLAALGFTHLTFPDDEAHT